MATTQLRPMVSKFGARDTLSEAELEVLEALPCYMRKVEAGQYLVREGAVAEECVFLASGLACRQKETREGRRQILSIHVPGDFLDLQNLYFYRSDHDIRMLTAGEVGRVKHADMRAMIDDRPMLGRALWRDTLIDASIFREWMVNIGRRDAPMRVAHLVCELAVRMRVAGLIDSEMTQFSLPMTQEQLGDALGLTPVHVNRTLKSLESRGLIEHAGRRLVIQDWQALCGAAGFSSDYLHLESPPE